MTHLLKYVWKTSVQQIKFAALVLILSFSFLGKVTAQNEDDFNPADTASVIKNNSYKKNPLSYLKKLDKRKIPYGALIDRVPYQSDVFLYNGVSKVKTAEPHHLKNFYNQIKYARNDSGRMLNYKTVNDHALYLMREKNLYPLMLMDIQYSHIKSSAIKNGSFVETDSCLLEKKKDKNNFSKNRFVYVSTFNQRLHGDQTTFLIDSFFFVKNHNNVKKLEFDFGDSFGFRIVKLGDKITIDYGSKSRHILAKMRLTVVDTSAKSGEKEFYAHFTFLHTGTDMVPTPSTVSQNTNKSSPVLPNIGSSTNNYGLLYYPEGTYFPNFVLTAVNYDCCANQPDATYLDGCYNITTCTDYYDIDHSYWTGREIEYCFLMGAGNNSGKLRKPIVIVDGFDPGNKRNYYSTYLDSYTGDPKIDDSRGLFQLMNGDKSAWSETNSPTASMVTDLQKNGYDIVFLNWMNGDGDITTNANSLRNFLNNVLNSPTYRDNQTEEMILVGPSMGGLITRYCLTTMEKAKEEHHVKLWFSFDSPQEGAYIPIALQHTINFLDYIKSSSSTQNGLAALNSMAAKQMLLYHYNPDNTDNSTYASNHRSEFKTFYDALHQLGYPSYSKNIAITNGGKELLYPSTVQNLISNFYCDGIYSSIWYEEVFDWLFRNVTNIHYRVSACGYGNSNDNSTSSGSILYANTTTSALIATIPRTTRYIATNNQIGFENAPGGFNTTLYTFNQTPQNQSKPSTDLVNYPQFSEACFMPTVSAFGIVPTRDNIYRTWDKIDLSETPFDDKYGMGSYGTEEHCRVSDVTSKWLQNYLFTQRVDVQKPVSHLKSSNFDEIESKSCLYTATNSVTLGGASGSSFTIKQGADVQAIAPKIILKQGFSVKTGAKFTAKIGNVVNGTQKSANVITPRATVTYLDPSPFSNKIYDYSTSSFEEKTKADCYFHIYPNPVKNILNIQTSGSQGIEIVEVKNIFSQVVMQKNGGNQTEISIDLSSLPNGVYFVCITGEASYVQKIIKN